MDPTSGEQFSANVLGPFTLLECRQTSVSFYP